MKELAKLDRQLPQTNTTSSDAETEISIYRKGELFSKSFYEDQKNIICSAFPSLLTNQGWFLVLMKRMKEKKFTNKRLEDAVNNMIDTCKYPSPALAEILSYDRQIKLLTYEQMNFKSIKQGKEVWELYQLVNIDGVPMYARNEDVKRYSLDLWEIKPPNMETIKYPDKKKEEDPTKWIGMFDSLLKPEEEQKNEE